MTTERMTDERRGHLGEFHGKWCTSQQEEVNAELTRARRVEQEQAEKIRKLEQQVLDLSVSLSGACNETAKFKDMLRLTNDKMTEQVRQARWEVANEALGRVPPFSMQSREHVKFYEWMMQIRNANAPKD